MKKMVAKKAPKKYAMGGSMTTTTETTKKPKPVAKKPESVSKRIGDINLRDVKNATETALDLSTLGGYGVAKKKIKKLTGMKAGGTMKKAQGGTSLGMKSVKSGYDNNSGVTRADFVAIGKGKAKSGTKMKMGGKMKTCKGGC